VNTRDVTERIRTEEALRRSQAELQRSREKLRAFSAGLIAAQEQEHKRISRDLHDDLNQRLAMLAVSVESLEQGLPAPPESLQKSLRSLGEQAAGLSDDVRRMAHELHPAIIEHLGLPAALRSYVTEFARRENMRVVFRCRLIPDDVSPEVSLCLYRVAQEALRNAARHARTPRVNVTLTGASQVFHLSIRDYGIGFDPESARVKCGLGLIGMEERVRLLNGVMSITSAPGAGVRLDFRVPVPKAEP
jgi:signal transduction histidine kinase